MIIAIFVDVVFYLSLHRFPYGGSEAKSQMTPNFSPACGCEARHFQMFMKVTHGTFCFYSLLPLYRHLWDKGPFGDIAKWRYSDLCTKCTSCCRTFLKDLKKIGILYKIYTLYLLVQDVNRPS